MEYRLLEKTELWISPLELAEADLEACARAAARALNLSPEEIMVTDAAGDRLTLDILVPTIQPEKIVARKEALLEALRKVPGVKITGETEIHSDGILGLISLDEKTGQEVLERSRSMAEEVSERVRRRAKIFSTGQEVLAGHIRDTNTPYLLKSLEKEGFDVARGPTLEDETQTIARAFCHAAEDGYGLVISTGGIGAEGKDQTLEALEKLDPHAVMPYILRFQKGQGRHHKDGVRIGVGVMAQTLFVCLPGPHDEVRLAWPVLKGGMQQRWGKENLAEALANVLRKKFLDRSGDHPLQPNHKHWEAHHGS